MNYIPINVIWNNEKVFTYNVAGRYNETITKQINGKDQIINFDT